MKSIRTTRLALHVIKKIRLFVRVFLGLILNLFVYLAGPFIFFLGGTKRKIKNNLDPGGLGYIFLSRGLGNVGYKGGNDGNL